MWRYVRAVESTDDNIKWRMRFPSYKTKVTNTHVKYVILIALPQQYWLRERASVLRYMNISFF
jgi:hypothetical protein